MRIGQGYDAHGWAADDRPLVIGGIFFPNETGLDGHSDGDVVTHAVIDAMLGAAGLGDIGQNFPNSLTAQTVSTFCDKPLPWSVTPAGYW